MTCQHLDFDEYFEKCTDCGADKHTVIAASFREQLQGLYTSAQEAMGIETGDIEVGQLIALEKAENELSNVVADWFMSAMDNL
jgi:hypothetical protein